jgi:DNA-binding SARP family transcriptional activator
MSGCGLLARTREDSIYESMNTCVSCQNRTYNARQRRSNGASISRGVGVVAQRDRLEFGILGSVVVGAEGRAIAVSGSRQRALLVRLLVAANEAIPSTQLVEDLWEGSAPTGAASTLQSYVSRLRHALGPRIRSRHGGYVLDVGDGELDADLFEAELHQGRRALNGGDPEGASALLARGLGRWRGPALADVAGALWALSEITRLDELRLRALELWCDAGLAMGQHQEVATAAEGAVAKSPLRERLWGQLMVALYRSGRQADALRAYQRLRVKLGEELGIEPGRELRALEEAILLQKPELDWQDSRPIEETAGVGVAAGDPELADLAGDGQAHDRLPGTSYMPIPSQVELSRRGGFFGRAEESRQLSEAWRSASKGHGRVAAISGEAGIGKTRLVAEFASGLYLDGCVVLWGRCDEDAISPYQSFTETLSHYFRHAPEPLLDTVLGRDGPEVVRLVPSLAERRPNLAPPVITDPEADRGRLLEALVGVVRRAAEVSPLLMVIDDLHNAPRDTLVLLRHVARKASASPLLTVVTYRDTDIDDQHPLHDLRAYLAIDDLLATVRLTGLDDQSVEALAASEAAVVRRHGSRHSVPDLRDRTGGNPFFCLQLLRDFAESSPQGAASQALAERMPAVPHGVRDVVRQRVDRLGPLARRVLQLASVVGMEFDLAVLVRLTDGAEDNDDVLVALEAAVAARLLDEIAGKPGLFRFVHALVHETLYRSLSAARRALLHRLTGYVLADRRSPATAVAHHLAEGASEDTVGDAVEWLRRAAAELIYLLAFEDAEAALLRALSLVDTWTPRDRTTRASLHLGLAFLLGVRGDTARQKRHAAEAAEDARAARALDMLADAAIERATWSEAGVADPVGGSLLEDALAAVGETDQVLRATLLAALAVHQGINNGRGRDMDFLAAEAVTAARAVGDRSLLFEVLHFRALLLQGSPELETQGFVVGEMEAIERDEADKLWDSPRSHWGRMKALLGAEDLLGWWDRSGLIRFRAIVELQRGNLAAFDGDLRLATESWRTSSRSMSATLCMWRGMRALLDGRFDEAAEHADAMLRTAGDDSNFRSSWAGLHFQIARERGSLAQLKPLVEAAIAEVPDLVAFRAPLALMYAELGELDAARGVVGSLGPDLRTLSGVLAASGILAQLAEVVAKLGDRTLALQLSEVLKPYRGQLIVVTWGVCVLGAADRFLGMLAGTLEEPGDADDFFRAALQLELSIDSGPLATRTRVCWARARLDRGRQTDRAAAASLLKRAAADAERLGMNALASEAAELLRAATE